MSECEKESQWYGELCTNLTELAKKSYGETRHYALSSDRGLAADIVDIEGSFEAERFMFDQENEELIIYTKIGKDIDTVAKVQYLFLEIFKVFSEGYGFFLPLHTSEELRFWFLIGNTNHFHKGKFIIELKDNPQIIR